MKNEQCRGFTLVELMIVIAIIGTLSAVAMGYYGNYVTDSNRTDARTALTQTSASLEKCKALYSVYDDGRCNVAFPVTSDDGLYSVAATAISNAAFLLTATPVVGGYQAGDLDCTSLTLTHTGIESGFGADVTECW